MRLDHLLSKELETVTRWVVVQMPFHRRVFCGGVLMGGSLTIRILVVLAVSSTPFCWWSSLVAAPGSWCPCCGGVGVGVERAVGVARVRGCAVGS